jgi:repressor LexA
VARPLTDRQRSILDFISSSTHGKGVPPSYQEIANHFRITVGGLQKQIKALETKGVLRRPSDRAARGLQVVAGQEVAGQVRLPILGQVRAGVPVEAIENVEDHIVLDPAFAKGADYVLRVKGDSMEPDMKEGDLALVQQASDAVSGEAVIAHVGDGAATVKILRRQGKEFRLEALNAQYEPIRGQSFRIVGRVLGLLRTFSRR